MSTRVVIVLAAAVFASGLGRAQDGTAADEIALKAAAAKVAPSVVKIDTAGGTEMIGSGKGALLKGTGSTTGLVVAADGYVITSSFNFANKPTEIFVSVPGKNRYPAKVIAADHSRMLTLLRCYEDAAADKPATDLPVPVAFPKGEVAVGQWALALGRTLDPDANAPPSVSAGIVSATNRVWGKAIQTDAKLSPTNYGGPLVALDGRVLGVVVPLSPRGSGETAGYEWYDSGIGFAVPLEDVLARLPALKTGKDLHPGVFGVTPKRPNDPYQARLEVGSVQPESAAAKAGIQVDDVIVAVDGKPVPNYSAFRHLIEPRYADDVVAVKVLRGDKEVEFKDVRLAGRSTAFVAGFFGVLPLRDDPGPGVPVRFVYPDSAAAKAGIAAGDRIMKVGPVAKGPKGPLRPVANRDALATLLGALPPGTELQVEVKKAGGKTDTVTVSLTAPPAAVPEKLPQPSSAGKALEGQPKKVPFPPECGPAEEQEPKQPAKAETGFLERTGGAKERTYWLYVPANYDPNVSHGLVVWFHPHGGAKDGEQRAQLFRAFCEEAHFIVMGPRASGSDGWVPSEADGVIQDVRAVMGQYTIDKARVVAHGAGNGGQMAYHLGFIARDLFRGVAVVGAALGTTPGDTVAGQPLAFFIAAGEKDPTLKQIEAGRAVLEGKKFPVVFRVVKDQGREGLDPKTFEEMKVWMDSLDRL